MKYDYYIEYSEYRVLCKCVKISAISILWEQLATNEASYFHMLYVVCRTLNIC